jgi:multicomponent Na+:H+ antiporter subunit D
MGIFGFTNNVKISILPAVLVALPLLTGLLLLVIGKRLPKTSRLVVIGTTLINFIIAVAIYSQFLGKYSFGLKYSLPKFVMGIGLNFGIDSLSLLFVIVITFMWLIVSIYSFGYMEGDKKQHIFYVLFLLLFASTLGIVVALDFFTLFIFFEFLGFLAYPLIIHEGSEEALRAGTKYLIMTFISGLLLLTGILLTYKVSGSFYLTNSIAKLSGNQTDKILIGFFLISGFGVKAGMIPLHTWLPDAHPVAPSPASALLSGVMIKAGAYGILRTVYVIYGLDSVRHLGVSNVLLVLAVITMIMGSAMALKQIEIKRLLAYSSVAQMGYILMGIALLTPRSLTGSLLHVFNHALMKGTLFLAAGAIIHQTGLRKLDDLSLLGKRMPYVMIAITIAAASMVGIPMTVGFTSKWYLATGAIEAVKMHIISQNWGIFLIAALLLSSMLNLLYYGPIVLRGWIGSPLPQVAGGSEKAEHKGDPSWKMLVPILVLAAAILIFGVFPQLPLGMAQKAANLMLGAK